MAVAGMKALHLEASSDIKLRPGGEYHLALGSLGSAGYTWESEIVGPQGVVLVRTGPPGKTSPVHPTFLQTYSVESTYVIEAVGPGSVEVKFSLRRPWEKGTLPAKIESFQVTVMAEEQQTLS